MAESSLSSEHLSRILRHDYGVEGTISRLPGENENYLVTEPSGRRFVYKFADPERTSDLIDLEHRAVDAIVASGLDLGLPRIVPTRQGDIESTDSRPDGTELRGRLVEFVDGTAWVESGSPSVEQRRDLGRRIAEVALALAGFDHPAAHRTHRWDLTAVDHLRSNISRVSDERRRQTLHRAFRLYVAGAQLFLDDLPQSIIHGDWNDENTLISEGKVVALLDFGDCLYNPTICELAIAVTYAIMDETDPLAAGADIVAGFHEIRPLSAEELEVLFPLICGRLAASLSTAAERRQIDPDRAAWFAHEERAWQAIERMLKIDPVEAARRLASGTGLEVFTELGKSSDELLEHRRQRFTGSLSVSYEEPLKIVRGRGQFLFDERGWPYLDLYNNVCHVGHCHPRVVTAGARQMKILNTNTRYLYDGLTEYAERLCATLPAELQYCFLVNSGSEANELAIRLAREHTGNDDLLVVEGAYHGHTTTMIDISPYKFLGKGGSGASKEWVQVVPVADGYRGEHKGQGRSSGVAYGDEVGAILGSLERPVAGFICESLISCGGQVIPPDGYFETVYKHVRQAGGVCIADEVQVGFGRVGSHFWAFELQNVVPDIVVMGKPIGNGHPMSAVITTSEIAESFARTGMEFFSTFGGNPVSCAIGMAVLNVIGDEGLQQNAARVGTRLRDGLRGLMGKYPLIGDVRGVGLFIGVELVRDRSSLEPAPMEAEWVVNELRRRRILAGTEGIFGNVIKIKPPMVITEADADWVVENVDEILSTYTPG